MSKFKSVTVTDVHHWNDTLFSFKTEREDSLRFKNGQFVMIGLEVEGKPLMRAYSIASANYDPYLEFFSIKVQDGALTSRLQHLKPGDQIFISSKPTGTLLLDYLLPGKNLYLLATGTGLAPFISVIKDPEIYDNFDKIILTHGVRTVSELAYRDFITKALPNHEYLGELVQEKLLYYPTVTREEFERQGRLTDLMTSGKMFEELNLEPFNVDNDRFMICGSPSMLKDFCQILDERGFEESRGGYPKQYTIERAFVES